jgi:glycosyltransferase involved in cell wall biosynthesis
MKPVIVFVSAVCPGQFSLLSDYLNETGLAEAFYLTTPGNKAKNETRHRNLIAFEPDGKIVGPMSYYYSAKTERSARIGLGVFRALNKLQESRHIDLLVCHGLWGAPIFLFDELNVPVVSYLEFPCYRAHGWQADYPPDLAQRLTDRNMEMLSHHVVLKSDLTIVPSAFARSLFPVELQQRIVVQFEGFDITETHITETPMPESPPPCQAKPFTLGFSARDLSSAKGFEVFMRLADRLLREGEDARFIAIGDPAATTYGYEAQFVERYYKGDKSRTFKDFLQEKYPATKAIEFPGKLPYAQFAELLHSVDLFLYPLRHGVANWGLMEILARGKPIIASKRTFIPEIITDGVNGIMLDDDDDLWINTIRRLKADPAERNRLARAAAQTGQQYHIRVVAPRYMTLFERVIAGRV